MKKLEDMNLDEAKGLAEEMTKYYYKGFGNSLSGILASSEVYLDNLSEKKKKKAYWLLKEIEDFYKKIPFKNLHREEFYPLFITRDLIPNVKDDLDNLFKGCKQKDLQYLGETFTTLITVGHLYRKKLEKVLEKIGTFQGNENYKVRVIDPRHQKDEWYISSKTCK